MGATGMRQRENRSWFSAVGISLTVLVIVVLAVTGLVLYQHHRPSSANKAATTSPATSTNAQPISNSPTQPANANWPVYSNTKYGFSYKYPTDWTTSGEVVNNPN